MANTIYATSQTQVGLAIETTRGTAEAPTFWVPTKAPKYKPDLTLIVDDTLQGSMVKTYDLIPGLRYDGHGWDSYPYMDSFPVFVRAELGSTDTLTTAPAPTTLASSAPADSDTISTTASIAAGSWIVIGSGLTQETHLTNAVTGTGPYAVTLVSPLVRAQASGAAVTGLTGHKFSLLNNAGVGNQPPSVTLTDFDGEEWRQLTAAQLDKLTIKGTGTGLVDYTCSWFANPSVTPSAPTPSVDTVEAVPGWTLQASIGGTMLDYIVDWEFDLARSVKPVPALTGTENYFMYFADALTATGKITVVEQSGAPQLAQYLEGASEVFDFTVFDVASGYALNFHSSKCKFKTGELDRSKEWVQAVLEFEMLPTATDALAGGVSPLTISAANAQATSY